MHNHIKPFRAAATAATAVTTAVLTRVTTALTTRALTVALIWGISSWALVATAAETVSTDENVVLEEIIVTAQKREQSLRDLAASVNVVGGKAISDYNVLDFTELENVTTGLFLTRQNARNAIVSLRGLRVDPESGSAPAVDIYLNGAPVRNRVAFGQMYDIERVEVLRGPQGAFQGKTSPAGSIQIYTRNPDMNELDGYAQAQAGSNDATRFQGALSLPLIKNILAVRIAGEHDRNDGEEITNLITGKLQDHESESRRVSIVWNPSENFSAVLKYDNIERKDFDAKRLEGARSTLASPQSGTPTPCAFAGNIPAAATCITLDADERAALAATDDYVTFDADIYNLHLNWYFTGHKLSWNVNYIDSESFSRQENDATYNLGLQNALLGLGPTGVTFNNDFRTFQTSATSVTAKVHELRLESDREGNWQYMLGFYSDVQDTLTPFIAWSAAARYVPIASAFPPENLTAPIPAIPMFGLPPYDLTITGGTIVGANFSTIGRIPFDSENQALFTHHKITLNDRVTLEAALRYTETERFTETNILFGEYYQPELVEIQGLTYSTSLPPLPPLPPLPATVTDPAAQGYAAGLQMGFLGNIGATNIVAIPEELKTFEDDALTGMLSVRYKYSEDMYMYASYNRGYRIGGISVVPAPFAIPSDLLIYGPEKSDSLEVGIKSGFWDGRGELNAALFHQRLNDHFGRVVNLEANRNNIPDDTCVMSVAENCIDGFPGGISFNGDATSTGLEVEARLLLLNNWSLNLGATWVKAEWDSAAAPCNDRTADEIVGRCDIGGQQIAGEPSFSFNLNTEYRQPISGDMSGFVRASWKYKGDIVSTAAQATGASPPKTDAYSIMNLYLGVESASGLVLTLWAKNLLDEDARTDFRNPGDNLDTAGDFQQVHQVPQRTYGLTTRYNF